VTRPLKVVLAGGATTGEPWVTRRLPKARVLGVDDAHPERLRRELRDADAVVAGELGADATAEATRLRLVHVLGAGWDGIAVDGLPPGCAVCNVHEHETAIGEWALMAMLALARRLLVYDRDLRRGEWHTAFSFGGTPERDLRGRTFGSIGLGWIGGGAVARARAIGMRAIAVTRTPTPERTERLGLDWLGSLADLPRLLAESDFVLVCVPLAPETTGLIGERELQLIGPEGYLLNVARGPIVEEEPLFRALRDGALAGAALDVWYRYPSRVGEQVQPSAYPFWELDNVVMTPHSAGWSESTLSGRWTFIAEQLARLAEGRRLENVVHGRA
jgi:phosphoglycerate dehydrogenase-like enzyme